MEQTLSLHYGLRMNTTKNQISRRSFLKQSAAAAAWLGMPALIPATAFGANNKTAVGCIGVGGMGTGNMRNFLTLDDCRVVAVCDTYEDRRQKAKGLVDKQYGDTGCAMSRDWREVIARKDIDALMIAPQDHWHALIAIAAAAAKKDMYLEKPTGVSVEESQKIVAAIGKHKRVFQGGTQQRSQQNFRRACELARNGYIGKLHTVEVSAPGPQYQPRHTGSLDPQPVPDGFDWNMWRGPAPAKPYNPGRVIKHDWYLIWDYCAGFISNWGVHHLDIANWGCPLLGKEPCEIECKGVYRKKGFTDNIESWNATFTYRSGLKMIFTDPTVQKTGTKFIGDKGWVYCNRNGTFEAEPASLLRVKLKDGELHLQESIHHQADFLNSVRTRKDPVSNVEATHVASYLGLIAEIAARLETKLKWDPKKEQFIGNDEANKRLSRPMYNGWSL
ncbi:MAG: twin-arginine translocation signal domain-containing protein [Verrucomicrobia bacterium]|nr:twin-arginine translocation signal domain-containing protein [Verrucomicrobiota bacterium]